MTIQSDLFIESTENSKGKREKIAAKYWEVETTTPKPAVVLLHGCGGWYGGNISLWADWFNSQEIHALAVESFASRGYHNGICSSLSKKALVGRFARIGDAYGGLEWLAKHPNVDINNVFVMGFSDGGTTALSAILNGFVPENIPKSLRFRGSLPIYPHCGFAVWDTIRPLTPVQIIIGSEDDWTPPGYCVTAKNNAKTDDEFSVHIIDGAHHSYDSFLWKGEPVSRRTYLGHTLEPSIIAVNETKEVIRGFLMKHIKN